MSLGTRWSLRDQLASDAVGVSLLFNQRRWPIACTGLNVTIEYLPRQTPALPLQQEPEAGQKQAISVSEGAGPLPTGAAGQEQKLLEPLFLGSALLLQTLHLLAEKSCPQGHTKQCVPTLFQKS